MSDRVTGRPFATRSEVLARNGMAATSQPLATETAIGILKSGGSATDAAIAANAAINAVEIATSCTTMAEQDIDADVVLVGDIFYSQSMADLALSVLQQARARGATVFVGDPGRA